MPHLGLRLIPRTEAGHHGVPSSTCWELRLAFPQRFTAKRGKDVVHATSLVTWTLGGCKAGGRSYLGTSVGPADVMQETESWTCTRCLVRR